MKTIQIPSTAIKSPEGQQFGFGWFVLWLLKTDVEFTKDWKSIESALKIGDVVKTSLDSVTKNQETQELIEGFDKIEGLELSLEDADFERLERAAKSPSQGGYPVQPAYTAVPWVKSIIDAGK